MRKNKPELKPPSFPLTHTECFLLVYNYYKLKLLQLHFSLKKTILVFKHKLNFQTRKESVLASKSKKFKHFLNALSFHFPQSKLEGIKSNE